MAHGDDQARPGAEAERAVGVSRRRFIAGVAAGAAGAPALLGPAAATAQAPPAAPAHARTSRRWPQTNVSFPIGPFEKHAKNPILSPDPSHDWESAFLYNPCATVVGGRVALLYRAQNAAKVSSIGLAWSRDGVHFERRPEPVLTPTEPYETPGGCEDPRVVHVDGTYYMTYTGYDGKHALLCLATSRDLVNWTKHGPLFPDFRDVGHLDRAPWSKSGAILATPIDGWYWMYFGESWIYWARSRDLISWELADTGPTPPGAVARVDDVTFTPTTARYMRVLGVQPATTYGYSVYEIEVRSGPSGPNLARAGSATASSQSLPPSNAIDGDYTTRWAVSAGDRGRADSWLAVDLGQTSTLDRVTVYWEAAMALSYRVQVSSNGTSWTDVATYDVSNQNDRVVARPVFDWENQRLEPGPPPILTRDGKILLVYNGETTGRGGYRANQYSGGQMLIDPADPTKALARLERPFIVPSTGDEQNGQVNNVVFSEGLVEFRGTFFLYFGMADSVLGVATWRPPSR
jgi:predicted GH43/DUF377 family glycosyl hydrolase